MRVEVSLTDLRFLLSFEVFQLFDYCHHLHASLADGV